MNLNFEVSDINILQDISDEQLAIAEVWICHSGMNAHRMPISVETIKAAAPTIINKFLVAGFNGWDFKSHEGKEQMIVGFFPKENDLRFIEKDGKTYFVANAIVSKNYATWAYEIFDRKNFKECSMEITVLDVEEKEDGLQWISSFVFNAVTILGDGIKAACPGSNVQLIKFAEEDIARYECIYHSKFTSYSVGEQLGTSNKIQILNDKNDAILSGAWRDPGATLLNKLLKASNHSSLVSEAYLVVDGNSGQDLAIGDVHYPHHVVRGGKLVVHQRGVQAAFSRAKQQGLTGSPIAHIKKHYTELGLNKENFAKFDITSEEYFKYFSEEEDNLENEKEKQEEMNYEVDPAKEEMSDLPPASEEKFEDAEEEKKETPEEEKKEDKEEEEKEEFSSDANSENVIPEELNKKDDETAKEMSVLREENESLKGRVAELEASIALMAQEKAEFEAAQYSTKVEFALVDAESDLTGEKVSALREMSKQYNFSTFHIFEALVKAEAYEISKTKEKKDKVNRFADPIFTPAPESESNVWARLMNKKTR